MTDRELMQQALDSLEYVIQSVGGNAPESFDVWFQKTQVPAEALRARLAQPEPEPVAWIKKDRSSIEVSIMSAEYMMEEGFDPLYAAPPQREWQGLKDDEIVENALQEVFSAAFGRGAKWAEAKLKEKNIR